MRPTTVHTRRYDHLRSFPSSLGLVACHYPSNNLLNESVMSTLLTSHALLSRSGDFTHCFGRASRCTRHPRKFVVQSILVFHTMPNSPTLGTHNKILSARVHNGRPVARETRSLHSLRPPGDSSCSSRCSRSPCQPPYVPRHSFLC